VSVARVPLSGLRNPAFQLVMLHNTSGATVEGPLVLVLHRLKRKVRLKGASGLAPQHGQPGDPFVRLDVTLLPFASRRKCWRVGSRRKTRCRVRSVPADRFGTGETS
jgi:hypothetical protein